MIENKKLPFLKTVIYHKKHCAKSKCEKTESIDDSELLAGNGNITFSDVW